MMEKYPQEVVDDLLGQIDALDVLELIDYHPESMQREGDIVSAFDPISQDRSGRYLTVNLQTKEFESNPPDMPRQTGNIIDLYARVKFLTLEAAMRKLADEFDILLKEGAEGYDRDKLLGEAEEFIAKAEKEEEERTPNMAEAEKRARRVLSEDAKDLEAQRLLFRVRICQKNPLTLVPVTLSLVRADIDAGNHELAVSSAKRHLEISPNDLEVHWELGEALKGLDQKAEAVEAYMRLADLAEGSNNLELALRAYRRVRELGDDSFDVYPMIINLLETLGKWKEAAKEVESRIAELKEARKTTEALREVERKIKLAPGDYDARLQIVDLCIQQGLTDELLDRAVEQADYLVENGELEKAAEALTYLTAEQPENLLVLETLIDVYKKVEVDEMVTELQLRVVEVHRKHDNAPEAYLILEELLANHPGDKRLLRQMSEMLLKDNSTKEALIILNRLAKLEAAEGETEAAAATCGKIVELEPENLDAREREYGLLLQAGKTEELVPKLETLARMLEQRGETGQLFNVLERTQEAAGGDAPLLQFLASLYRKLDDEEKAEEVRQQLAEALTSSGDLQKAEETVRELLAKDEDNVTLLATLADLQERRGDKKDAATTLRRLASLHRAAEQHASARQYLERLAELDPENPDVYTELSDLCTELGDEDGLAAAAEKLIDIHLRKKEYDAAAEQAELILELKPEHAEARLALFETHKARNRKDKALEEGMRLLELYREGRARAHELSILRSLADLVPGDGKVAQLLLQLLAQSGETEEMLTRAKAFVKAHKKEPDKAIRVLRDVHRESGTVGGLQELLISLYESAGRRDEMVAEMQRLIESELEAGNHDKALALYRDLLGKAPDSISTRAGFIVLLKDMKREADAVVELLALARQLQRIRKLQEAREAYEEAAKLTPENEEVFRGHADLLRDMGKPVEADAQLRELARLQTRQGKVEMALTTLGEILDREPANHEVRRDIIRLKKDRGNVEEALSELRALAATLQEEGDFEGAIAARRDAVLMAPDDPAVREELIEALRESGRTDEALTEQLELAEVCVRAGDHEKSLELVDVVLEADSGNIMARRARARIFDTMGDERRALEEYRRLQQDLDKAAVQTPSVAVATQSRPAEEFDSGLEILPEYDFDSFVVGSKNNFASATARAVAEHPGSARNPLFLYSDVGLGKTHLLHAIANHLMQSRPSIRIVYTSTEYFTSELIDAIQNNTVTQFRNKHRQSDVLLLDDVQFLAGKERSQEEFFHIFNMLYQARRQIVVTSDRPPKDISHLDMRLRTRFGQGVIVDIQPPDLETRIAILRADTNRRGITVSEDVLLLIAERITSNVRELKGALNQLITQHEIGGSPLDAETAGAIVEKYFAV